MPAPEDGAQQPAPPTCLAAAEAGLINGCLGGLVVGLIWGIVQEKKFMLRNIIREPHLREAPARLLPVMMRSLQSCAVLGTFAGALRGLRCANAPMLDPLHPLNSLAAGTLAGAVKSAVDEVPRSMASHGRQAVVSGVLATVLIETSKALDRHSRRGP
ncbi:hypothetical protein WJX74_009495 [Apatococcus lobatus]|uniref:Uncharacterized protein n=1 Tax=Apatococcus lobatus TaxID=904363 RepID=A0AAW1S185_9CHLO